jgi:hypothetical protein
MSILDKRSIKKILYDYVELIYLYEKDQQINYSNINNNSIYERKKFILSKILLENKDFLNKFLEKFENKNKDNN